MICSKCGHNDSEKAHSLDPWCMYQVKDGVVINAMFLPDRIPEGWYDSPKAAKQATAMEIIGKSSTKAVKISLADKLATHDPMGVELVEVEKIIKEVEKINKIDGRTKAGRKLKAKVNDDCTGTN